MSMLKYGYASVVTPAVCPGKWVDKKVGAGRMVLAKSVIAKYDPSQWMLTHCTIMAAVDVDLAEDGDKKSNYLIKPEYSIFVNNNGDSWERELLRMCSKSFLGADVFVEHVQIPILSKGKVIDVAIREVPFMKGQDGKDLTALYVDILLATNRKHTDLIDKINNGEYSTMSMGCLIKASRCSQCGKYAEDEANACQHVRFFKNNHFYDKNGVKRMVAELCGVEGEQESCKFIDASWVRKPAFAGAVLRNIVAPGEDVSDKIQTAVAFPSFKAEKGMNLKAASVMAKELVNEVQAADAPATPPPPSADAPAMPPPADDSRFPSAPPAGGAPLSPDPAAAPMDPSGAPPVDPLGAPPADPLAGLGGGAPPAPGGMGAPMPGAPPAAPAAPPAPPVDPMVAEIATAIKSQIINEIKDKLNTKPKATTTEERPQSGADNDSNGSIIKQSSMSKVLESSKKIANDRLHNGLMLLANLKDWSQFRKYGYNRNDVLGILHYVDMQSSAEPVSRDAVKVLSQTKTASKNLEGFFRDLIVETGRRPSTKEAKKLAKWATILSNFS